MDCYKIARRIMDRIRSASVNYCSEEHITYQGVLYYDSSVGYEYFILRYDGVAIYILRGKLYRVEIDNPRGLICFNIRLWLLKLDRMTK